MFLTQYTPDFFVAEYCVLRNTTTWGSKDLASGPGFEALKTYDSRF
jgi:hypothetical protein